MHRALILVARQLAQGYGYGYPKPVIYTSTFSSSIIICIRALYVLNMRRTYDISVSIVRSKMFVQLNSSLPPVDSTSNII